MSELKKLVMMTQQEDIPYLCITALEDGMHVSLDYSHTEGFIEYSPDKVHWYNLPAKEPTQPVNGGKSLYFRGELIPEVVTDENNNVNIGNSKGIGCFTINKS
jgi:hypothetical protein